MHLLVKKNRIGEIRQHLAQKFFFQFHPNCNSSAEDNTTSVISPLFFFCPRPSKLVSSQHCQLLQLFTSLWFLFIPLFCLVLMPWSTVTREERRRYCASCLGSPSTTAPPQGPAFVKTPVMPVPLNNHLWGSSCQMLRKTDLTSGSKKKKSINSSFT